MTAEEWNAAVALGDPVDVITGDGWVYRTHTMTKARSLDSGLVVVAVMAFSTMPGAPGYFGGDILIDRVRSAKKGTP